MDPLPRTVFFRPRQPLVFDIALPGPLNLWMIVKAFAVGDGFRLVRSLAPIGILDLPRDLRKEFGQVVLVSERR